MSLLTNRTLSFSDFLQEVTAADKVLRQNFFYCHFWDREVRKSVQSKVFKDLS